MSKKIEKLLIDAYQKNARLKIQYVLAKKESMSAYPFKRSKMIDGDAVLLKNMK